MRNYAGYGRKRHRGKAAWREKGGRGEAELFFPGVSEHYNRYHNWYHGYFVFGIYLQDVRSDTGIIGRLQDLYGDFIAFCSDHNDAGIFSDIFCDGRKTGVRIDTHDFERSVECYFGLCFHGTIPDGNRRSSTGDRIGTDGDGASWNHIFFCGKEESVFYKTCFSVSGTFKKLRKWIL